MAARPPAQAAIAFVGNNFDTAGKLVGRQSASAGFLRAYLSHGGAKTYTGLSNSPVELDGFRAFAARNAPQGIEVRGLLSPQLPEIASLGTLFRPGPDLAHYAWLRRGFDQRGFSLVGVNHTLSGHDAAAALGGLLTGPVQEWDALVCTSNASRQVVRRFLEEYGEYFGSLTGTPIRPRLQLPVIPLGVDCDAFMPPQGQAAARAAERQRLGIEDDEVVLLYLGRLNHVEKANPLPMYIAAEQVAAATGRKIRLVEAGWFPSPEIERIFEQGAATMAPSVKRQVVDASRETNRRVWFAADIFISLSDNIQESFGLTPIEAMAAGLPVLASDWDGYRDTVEDGTVGFRVPTLAPPAGVGEALAFLFAAHVGGEAVLCGGASQGSAVDPSAASTALERLVRDEELRRRMGEAGRERARRLYDWPVVVAGYQALWAELAEIRQTAIEAAPVIAGRAARPFTMDPYDLFGQFPTTILAADSIFTLTPGITPPMALGMTKLPLATPLRILLLPDELLSALVETLARGPATAGTLLGGLPPTQNAAGWMTLGWLVKTGLAACG